MKLSILVLASLSLAYFGRSSSSNRGSVNDIDLSELSDNLPSSGPLSRSNSRERIGFSRSSSQGKSTFPGRPLSRSGSGGFTELPGDGDEIVYPNQIYNGAQREPQPKLQLTYSKGGNTAKNSKNGGSADKKKNGKANDASNAAKNDNDITKYINPLYGEYERTTDEFNTLNSKRYGAKPPKRTMRDNYKRKPKGRP